MNTRSILPFIILLLVSCSRSPQSPAKTTVETLVKTSLSWNGSPLPAYPKGKPEVTLLRITIPGHTALPWHTHPVINAGLILKGRLTVVTKKGKMLKLKEGDPIMEVVDTWHMGKNEHDEPVVIAVFYAGLAGKPITVKKQGLKNQIIRPRE